MTNEIFHETKDKPVYDARWGRSRGTNDSDILCFSLPATQVEFFYLHYNRLITDAIKKYLPNSSTIKLLEVGCGRGTSSLYQALISGAECYLTDFSLDALKIARENFSKYSKTCRVVQGNAYGLPIPDNSFDCVISLGVLEHFPNPTDPMKEMHRVLKPGGVMISMNVPEKPDNIQRIVNPMNRLLTTIHSILTKQTSKPWLDKTRSKTGDVYRTYADTAYFVEATKRAGFDIIAATEVNPFPTIAPLPAPVDWIVVRIYEMVLALRKLVTDFDNPYFASQRNSRCNFVFARKHSGERLNDSFK